MMSGIRLWLRRLVGLCCRRTFAGVVTPVYDLGDRRDRKLVYQQVLAEGLDDDVRYFIDVAQLADLWFDMPLPAYVRDVWGPWLRERGWLDYGTDARASPAATPSDCRPPTRGEGLRVGWWWCAPCSPQSEDPICPADALPGTQFRRALSRVGADIVWDSVLFNRVPIPGLRGHLGARLGFGG